MDYSDILKIINAMLFVFFRTEFRNFTIKNSLFQQNLLEKANIFRKFVEFGDL